MNSSTRTRGSALIVALWMLGFLSFLAVGQAVRVSQQARWMQRLSETRESRSLVWAGMEQALANLSASSERFGRLKAGETVTVDGSFSHKVEDESAKIPLNAAGPAILARLPGFTLWSADEIVKKRKDRWIVRHLSQLRSVSGFDAARLPELVPLVTLDSMGPVNMNTASAEVLALLGLSKSLSEQIAVYRTGPDGIAGTKDDRIFEKPEEIAQTVDKAAGPLSTEDQSVLAGLLQKGVVGAQSSFYRITATGWSGRHAVRRQAVAVVERLADGQAPVIRSWHEG